MVPVAGWSLHRPAGGRSPAAVRPAGGNLRLGSSLAQKDVEDHPGVPPLLIVGLRLKRRSLRLASRHADRRLAARVADGLDLGAPFYVIPLNRETRRPRERLQRTVAPVYARATA